MSKAQGFWNGLSRSMRHRNYRLFFSGQSISLIGTWMTRLATSWLVYRLTHSAWMLGVVNFAGLIPTFLMAPVAGVLADRWDKHRVLIATQVLAALQSAALAVLTLLGIISIHEILALSIFQGLINAFDFPVRQAFVVQIIEDRADLPNAIALNSSMTNMARLVGPSAAGILIASIGEGGCFSIDALSYLAVIATLLMMSVRPGPKKAAVQKDVLKELKDGFRYARDSRAISSVLCLLALVSFMGVPYLGLLPIIVSKQFAGDARVLGYLTGAAGLGALMGALFLASRTATHGLRRITAIAALTFGAGLICLGLSRSLWFSFAMMLISGLGMTVQVALSNTILQTLVPEDKRGRVMSLFIMAYAGMAPFGSLFGGFLADRIGASATFEWGGAACCLGALLFFRSLPKPAKIIA